MNPFHHPEFLERFAAIAFTVFVAVRCLSLFFRRVLGIPYSVRYELYLNVLTTGAVVTFFVSDLLFAAKGAAILLGGSAWGTWAEWRAKQKKAQKER